MKIMNKRYFKWKNVLLAVVVVFILTAVACTGGNGEIPTLKIYNWADTDVDGIWNHPDDPYAFYAIYSEDECKVEWDFYLDTYAALAKMEADPAYADVISTIGSSHTSLWYDRPDPLIGPIDTDLLPCWDEMYPALQDLPGMWYGEDLVAVPESFGLTLMQYRTDMLLDAGFALEEFANNLSFIFKDDPRLHGKIYYYDSADESLPFLLMAAGVPPEDIWTNNVTKLQPGGEYYELLMDKWVAAKDNIGGFWAGWYESMEMLTGENPQAWILNAWNDIYMWSALDLEETLNLTDGRDALGYMASNQSVLGYCTCVFIRAGLAEEDPYLYEAAHVWTNANISKFAGIYRLEEWAFGTPNMNSAAEAEPYADWLVEEFNLDDPETLIAEANFYQPLENETHEAWTNLWVQLKAAL